MEKIEYRACNQTLKFLRLDDGSLLPADLTLEEILDLHLREAGRRAFTECLKAGIVGSARDLRGSNDN